MKTPSLSTSFSSSSTSSSSSRKNGPRRPLSPAATASVQVVVRVRPLNEREKKHGTLPVISASTSDKTVTVIKGSGARQVKSSYKFDNVFTSFSTQEDVFEATLQPIIRDVLNGYESTVFAYGQTGTGKTHTMEGDLSNIQEHGVIPRSAAAIFDALKKDPDYLSSTVHCSLLEIYNEELSDLLLDRSSNTNNNTSSNKRGNSSSSSAAKPPKLAIMEGEHGPFCRGLSETQVTSAEDLLRLMQTAHQHRMTGETDMNQESSRSHCIFTLRVQAKRRLTDGSVLEASGKLHCVDLAGSECAKSCGNAGKQQAARERERMNINRSLLTLGRVVKLLKEKSEKPASQTSSVRIPYRDSKLTRILQESLGGRCKTCLIATISPSITAIEESMSTLNYAQAANGIVNKPITTSLMTVGGLDNKSPKNAGDASSGSGMSVEHWHEMECRLEYMQSQVDEAQQALARKHLQHQEFQERAERAEHAKELAERQFQKATHEISVLEQNVQDLSQQLAATQHSLQETKVVLGATQRTEVSLTEEAQALLQVIQTTIRDGDRMHEALVEKRQEEVERKSATHEYQTAQSNLLLKLQNYLQEIASVHQKHRAHLATAHGEFQTSQLQLLEQHAAVVEELKTDCTSDIESLKNSLLTGVLPVFSTLTKSSRDKLATISAALMEGEQQLQADCQSVLDRLTENSKKIAQLEQSYTSSSNTVLETLATHLQATKQHLTGTLVGITEALQKTKADRDLQRERLTKSLDSYKEECSDSMDQLGKLSKSHTECLQESIQSVQDGASHRSTILQELNGVDLHYRESRNENLRKLSKQEDINTAQHKELIGSQHVQREKTKALMKNLMSGMQSLLEKELKSMSEFHEEHVRALVHRNYDSKCYTDEMRKLAMDSYQEGHSKNEGVTTKIQKDFQGQEDLCTALETETGKFGKGIQAATDAIRTPLERFSDETTKTLQTFAVEDTKSTESLVTTTKSMVEAATQELTCGVQEGMEEGISKLQASATEGFRYVREHVLDPVQSQVAEAIRPHQSQVYASARDDLSSLNNQLHDGESAVVGELNQGLVIAAAVERRLEVGASETFAGTIQEHKKLLGESQWLETALQQQEETLTTQVSTSATLVSSSADRLEEFARETLLVHEATPEVKVRSVPEYSNHLSCTKERDVLLREAGLGGDTNESSNIPRTNETETETSETLPEPTVAAENESSSAVVPLRPSTRSTASALRDRSGSINSVREIEGSPPLKRVAETTTTKSNLPNHGGAARRSSKRFKTRLR